MTREKVVSYCPVTFKEREIKRRKKTKHYNVRRVSSPSRSFLRDAHDFDKQKTFFFNQKRCSVLINEPGK